MRLIRGDMEVNTSYVIVSNAFAIFSTGFSSPNITTLSPTEAFTPFRFTMHISMQMFPTMGTFFPFIHTLNPRSERCRFKPSAYPMGITPIVVGVEAVKLRI